MASPSVLGAQIVNFAADGSATPAAVALTIPAGTKAVVYSASCWDDDAADRLSTITLDGVAPDERYEAHFYASQPSAIWFDPPIGTYDLLSVWAETLTEGPGGLVIFLGDVDTAAGVIDADTANTLNYGGNPEEVAEVDCAVDDFVLHLMGSKVPQDDTVPSGWTDILYSPSYNAYDSHAVYKIATTTTVQGDGNGPGTQEHVTLIVFRAPTGGGSPDVTLNLTGQLMSVAAGSLAPARAVAVAGSAVASATGTLAPTRAVPLVGQAVAVTAGTLTASLSLALTGQALTIATGTITYSAGGNLTLSLTGQAVAVAAGSLGLSSTFAVAGSSVAAAAGTIAADRERALTGSAAAAALGSLGVGSAVPVVGQGVAADTGTIAPARAVAVSGSAVTATAGSLGVGISVGVTGQALVIATGTLAYTTDGNLTLALTGQVVSVATGRITSSGGTLILTAAGGFIANMGSLMRR